MENQYTCIEPGCGEVFEITPGEMQFYEDKGYELPKRCPECRKRRREAKNR